MKSLFFEQMWKILLLAALYLTFDYWRCINILLVDSTESHFSVCFVSMRGVRRSRKAQSV